MLSVSKITLGVVRLKILQACTQAKLAYKLMMTTALSIRFKIKIIKIQLLRDFPEIDGIKRAAAVGDVNDSTDQTRRHEGLARINAGKPQLDHIAMICRFPADPSSSDSLFFSSYLFG